MRGIEGEVLQLRLRGLRQCKLFFMRPITIRSSIAVPVRRLGFNCFPWISKMTSKLNQKKSLIALIFSDFIIILLYNIIKLLPLSL